MVMSPLVTEHQEEPATAVRWNLREEVVSEGTAGPWRAKQRCAGRAFLQREQYGEGGEAAAWSPRGKSGG